MGRARRSGHAPLRDDVGRAQGARARRASPSVASTIPDAQLDLVGLYVVRAIPSDAYALILGEHPQDYWYVLPVTILVALIGLLFAWALVRAVKRDLLAAPARDILGAWRMAPSQT